MMEEKKDNFSAEQLQALAKSDAGKRLMAMLSGTDTADAVRKNAQAGDMAAAQKALQAFLTDPKAQALLRQLEDQSHG